jgi:hypothetical protein
MPKQTTVTPFKREEPRQQDTFRFGPDVQVQARPVDAYASPGGLLHAERQQNAAVFQEVLGDIRRTSSDLVGIGHMKEEEDFSAGKGMAARGETPEEGTNAFFKGYYGMKAVADSSEHIKELDAYNDKNWAKDDE